MNLEDQILFFFLVCRVALIPITITTYVTLVKSRTLSLFFDIEKEIQPFLKFLFPFNSFVMNFF